MSATNINIILALALASPAGEPQQPPSCPAAPLRDKEQVLLLANEALSQHKIDMTGYKLFEVRYDCMDGRPIWFVAFRQPVVCLHCTNLVIVGDRDATVRVLPGT